MSVASADAQVAVGPFTSQWCARNSIEISMSQLHHLLPLLACPLHPPLFSFSPPLKRPPERVFLTSNPPSSLRSTQELRVPWFASSLAHFRTSRNTSGEKNFFARRVSSPNHHTKPHKPILGGNSSIPPRWSSKCLTFIAVFAAAIHSSRNALSLDALCSRCRARPALSCLYPAPEIRGFKSSQRTQERRLS